MPATRSTDELSGLQRLLVDSVREAGHLALAALARPLRTWRKANGSPVSDGDMAVDEFLHARLTAATPDYGWLSEERADDAGRLTARRLWIVDPIDGTRAYIGGRPDWTVAAALVEGSRPLVGVIYAPVEQALFVAVAGQGATLNDAPIRASGGDTLEDMRVSGPRKTLDRLRATLPGAVVQPKIYSVALRLARVAEGALDAAFVSGSGQDWDLAAADLLVHEAGGQLTTYAGEQLTYNRPDPVHGALVAAGRERQARLLEWIEKVSLSLA